MTDDEKLHVIAGCQKPPGALPGDTGQERSRQYQGKLAPVRQDSVTQRHKARTQSRGRICLNPAVPHDALEPLLQSSSFGLRKGSEKQVPADTSCKRRVHDAQVELRQDETFDSVSAACNSGRPDFCSNKSPLHHQSAV